MKYIRIPVHKVIKNAPLDNGSKGVMVVTNKDTKDYILYTDEMWAILESTFLVEVEDPRPEPAKVERPLSPAEIRERMLEMETDDGEPQFVPVPPKKKPVYPAAPERNSDPSEDD